MGVRVRVFGAPVKHLFGGHLFGWLVDNRTAVRHTVEQPFVCGYVERALSLDVRLMCKVVAMSVALAPLHNRPGHRSHTAATRPSLAPGRTIVRVPRSVASAAPGPAVYRRRRAVVAVFVASLVAVVGLAAGGGEATPISSGTSAMQSYLVQPGDTLWAIAAQHAGSMPMADYVDVLVEVNGGSQVRAGEWIVLP
jgi:hypothetical protein